MSAALNGTDTTGGSAFAAAKASQLDGIVIIASARFDRVNIRSMRSKEVLVLPLFYKVGIPPI